MSGGGGTFLNPNTKFPQQAWELHPVHVLARRHQGRRSAGSARITARQDVNKEVLSKDPLLSLISEKVLPITRYRPGLAVYPQVSQALQQATADIVSGKSRRRGRGDLPGRRGEGRRRRGQGPEVVSRR